MQFTPGKPYASCGADRAPFSRNTRAPTLSSSLVDIPGLTLLRIAAIASATTCPARISPSRSAWLSIDTGESYGSGHAEDVGDRFQLPEEQVGEPLERRLPQVVPVLAESSDHLFTAPAESGESKQAV